MGLDIPKHNSYIFHPMSAKLHEDIGYHGGIQAITFLGNRPRFKNLTCSQWKILKMCNILKTAARRAKRMKMWDFQFYVLYTSM